MKDLTTLRYWLALNRLPGIGPVTVDRWLEKAGDVAALFTEKTTLLERYGVPANLMGSLQTVEWEKVDKDLQWLASHPMHHILIRSDAEYPPLLNEIASAPMVLFVKGDPALLSSPQLAMVGSRHPTGIGTETAFEFAKQLSAQGWTITSGLALGIDAASHQGALASAGKTIAVVGTGLDRLYPAQHKALAEELLNKGGAIISEFPVGTPAKAEHFPRRNRLISGLSQGTLVVEAALQSGSLITARYATEQNREVFAIPGSIHNPLARGCHQLIRSGAKLVETVQDILEELAGGKPVARAPEKIPTSTTPIQLPEHLAALLKYIDYASTPIDVIVQRSGLSVSEVASAVLILELQGYLESTPGGYSRTHLSA